MNRVLRNKWGILSVLTVVLSALLFQNCSEPLDVDQYLSYSKSLEPIETLYSTGVDDNGVVLAHGDRDPHYLLIDNELAYLAPPTGNWIANDAISGWIIPGDVATQTKGKYLFKTHFSLQGYDYKTAVLKLKVSVDDTLNKIILNDVVVFDREVNTEINFSSFTGFSDLILIDSEFSPGENVLEFVVENTPEQPTPTGIRVIAEGFAKRKK